MSQQGRKFSFKVCLNCSAQNASRRRVCQNCGKGQGKSFFRDATPEELQERAALEQRVRDYLKELDDDAERHQIAEAA